MPRGQSPARGTTAEAPYDEDDALVKDAIEEALNRWNNLRECQVTAKREDIKILTNGNVTIPLATASNVMEFDTTVFVNMMTATLKAECTVRQITGVLTLVASKNGVLAQIPLYRFRCSQRVTRIFGALFTFSSTIGIIVLIVAVCVIPYVFFPEVSNTALTWIFTQFKGVTSSLWEKAINSAFPTPPPSSPVVIPECPACQS